MTPKHAPVEFFYREPNKATFTYFNGVSTPTDYVIVRGSYASIRLSISGVVKLDPSPAPGAAPPPLPAPMPVPAPAPVPVLPTAPAQQPVLVPPAHAPGRARRADSPRVRALREREERALRAPEPPAYLRDFDRTEPLPLRTPSEALSDQLDAVLALAAAGTGGGAEGAARAARTSACLRELSTLLESERDCSVDLRQLDLGCRGAARAALAPFLAGAVARAAPRAVRLEALRCASLLCPTNEDFARAIVACGGLAALAHAARDAAHAPAASATAPTLVLALVACLRHMLASPCCVRAFVEPYPPLAVAAPASTTQPQPPQETVVHVLTRLLAHCAAAVPAMVEPAQLVLRVCRFYAQHVQPFAARIPSGDDDSENSENGEKDVEEDDAVARLGALGAALEACAAPEAVDAPRDRMELTGVVAALQAGDVLGRAAHLLAHARDAAGGAARSRALVAALSRCVRPLFACRSGFFLLFNQCAAVKRLVRALQTPAWASDSAAAALARAVACRMHMARPMLARADAAGARELGAALAGLAALGATGPAHARALAHTVAACRPTAALVAEFTRALEARDAGRLRALLALVARALAHQARHATPDYVDAAARIHRILADADATGAALPADVRALMRALAELTRLPHRWAASTPTTRPVAELVRALARPVLPAHFGALVAALGLLGSVARSPAAPHRTALLQPAVLAALAQILTDCTVYFDAASVPAASAPTTTLRPARNNSSNSSDKNSNNDPVEAFAERCQMAWDVVPIARLAVELAHAVVHGMLRGALAAPRLAAACVDVHLAACALPFCACATRAPAAPGTHTAALARLQARTAALLAPWAAAPPAPPQHALAHLCARALGAPRALGPALRLLARLVGTPLHRAADPARDATVLRVLRAAVRTHSAALHEPLALVCAALAHARPRLPLHAAATTLLLDTADAVLPPGVPCEGAAAATTATAAVARVLALLWCALDGAAAPLPCADRAATWVGRVLARPLVAAPVVRGLALGCARALLVAGCGGADSDTDTVAATVAAGVAAGSLVPVRTAGDAAGVAGGLALLVHPAVRAACRARAGTRAAVAGAVAGAHDGAVALLRSLAAVDDAETAVALAQLCCCVCREYASDGGDATQTPLFPEDVVRALEAAHPELRGVAEPGHCFPEARLADDDDEGADSAEAVEAHVRRITDTLLEAGFFGDGNTVGSDTARQLLRRPERAERPPALLAMARQQHHIGDYLTGSWRKVELDAATGTFGTGPSLLPPP